jgi:GDP-mannose 6-dehydrogenase
MDKPVPSRVGVFGLGYVGAVSAACLVRDGHDVIGIDINPAKVAQLGKGESPVVEPGLNELLAEGLAAGRLRSTTDVAEAVRESDVGIICVGTPSSPNGAIDLKYVVRVSEQIAASLRDRTSPYTVLLRSTVVPGTTERVIRPLFEQHSTVRLGFHPEFLREATAVADYDAPARVVIGTEDPEVTRTVGALYPRLTTPPTQVPVRVAEVIKYADNAFHALKVGFANEIGALAKAYEVDGREVMRLFAEDHKLNISATYLQPGAPFGGSCLPKDLRALDHLASAAHVETPILRATLSSNAAHKQRVCDIIQARGRGRLAMLGLAFKPMTDDLRESPFVELAEFLIGKGHQLAIFDPSVQPATLLGSNLSYIQGELPHLERLLVGSIERALDGANVVVVCTKQPGWSHLASLLTPEQVVIDLAGFFKDRSEVPGRYEGICW